jgi:hypothetical protein
MRNPSRRLAQGISEAMKEFSVEYETVDAVTKGGTNLRGTLLNEDSFTIQFMDTRERVHSLDKASLKSLRKSRESLMPAYDEKGLPEKDEWQINSGFGLDHYLCHGSGCSGHAAAIVECGARTAELADVLGGLRGTTIFVAAGN